MDATSWRLAEAVQTADMIEQVISEDVLGAERQVLTKIGPETIKFIDAATLCADDALLTMLAAVELLGITATSRDVGRKAGLRATIDVTKARRTLAHAVCL